MLTITEFNFAGLEEVDHIANLRPDAFKDGGVERFQPYLLPQVGRSHQ